MPCLTPYLLTTHDIYSMSGDSFCSALQAHGTLSPALAARHRADRPSHPTAAARTAQIKSSRGHRAITFNLFSRAAAASLRFSSCDRGCRQLWAEPVPAPCPELGITSTTFLWLQAADREAFPWLTPSITRRNSV